MKNERIQALDELRGLAVLGMFAINILAFGLPYHAFADPGLASDYRDIDKILFWISSLAFEGTFRAIFCVLFGMGVLLQFERMQALHGEQLARIRHRRRMVWLMLFGLIDAYLLLWFGDILLAYGLIGLLLLRFRGLDPSRLLLIAGLLLMLLAAQNCIFGDLLSAPDNLEIDSSRDAVAGGYASAWPVRAGLALSMQLTLVLRSGWEILAFMLIGMAICKAGALSLAWSARQLAAISMLALLAGLGINAWEIEHAQALGQPALTLFLWSYDLGRLAMALACASLILLMNRLDILRGVRQCLAATGRMALSHYLLQSIICLWLFVGLGLFGELRYSQLMALAALTCCVQVAASVLWLRRFEAGPIERALRALISRQQNLSRP